MSVIADANKETLKALFPNLLSVLDVSRINWENPNIWLVIINVLTFFVMNNKYDYIASIVPTIEHLFELSNSDIIHRLSILLVSSCNPCAESVVLKHLPKILEMFQDSQRLTQIFGGNPKFLCKILMMSDEVYASLTRPFLRRFGVLPNCELFFEMFNRPDIEDVLALVKLRPDFLKLCLGTSEICSLFASKSGHGLAAIRQLMQNDGLTGIIIESCFFDCVPESHVQVEIIQSLIDFFVRTHSQMTLKQLFRLFEIDAFMCKLFEGFALESIDSLTENIFLALANTNLSKHSVGVFNFLEKCAGKVNFANIVETFKTLSEPLCPFPSGNSKFRERIIYALKKLE